MSGPYESSVPVVRTDRLTLRGYEPGDAEKVRQDLLADPRVAKGFVVIPPPTLDEAQRGIGRTLTHWAREGFGIWAVTDTSDGTLLGQCGLRRTDMLTDPELVYALARRHWGRGYASEAVQAALRFGFEQAALDQVTAVVRPENIRSQRVLDRSGFAPECTMDWLGVTVIRYGISRR